MKIMLKEYKSMVADLGCIVCGAPAMLHHPRFCAGMGQRSSDWLVIPLCSDHHQNGGYGTAIHAGQQAFEQNHGTEEQLLAKTIERVYFRVRNQ
jgi:hypothetical protein